MNQHPLENVLVPAQMRPPHATGVVEMREGAFDPLAALPHQAAPAWPAQAPTIAIDGRPRVRFFRPMASPSVRLGNVGADADGLEVDHRLIAVISLVADDLFKGLRLVDVRLRIFNLVRSRRRSLAERG